jgi:ATP-dependent RNA helicase DDX56/DBP9
MSQVDAFRYRVIDTLRSITSLTIREARLKEIRKQVINSEKLRAHFEDNPRDLEALVSLGGASHPAKVQGHLKIVPRYLLPVRDAGGNVLEGEKEVAGEGETVGRVFFDSKKQVNKKRTGGFKKGGGNGKKARVDALKF